MGVCAGATTCDYHYICNRLIVSVCPIYHFGKRPTFYERFCSVASLWVVEGYRDSSFRCAPIRMTWEWRFGGMG